jgi:hypothetical protein
VGIQFVKHGLRNPTEVYMEAVVNWLLAQGALGPIVIILAYLYYNERKERLEITSMYMQLQLEIMEILSDAKKESKSD